MSLLVFTITLARENICQSISQHATIATYFDDKILLCTVLSPTGGAGYAKEGIDFIVTEKL